MPIYEYECEHCGRFENFERIGEKALEHCPRCAEKKVRSTVKRVISAAAFHLKGSGWYKTDYANSSKQSCSGEPNASQSRGNDQAANGAASGAPKEGTIQKTATEKSSTGAVAAEASKVKSAQPKDGQKAAVSS